MFTRKRVKKLEDAVAQMRKQLNCPHDEVKYFVDFLGGGSRECAECGLVLKRYSTVKDMNADMAKDKRAKAEKLIEAAEWLEGVDDERESR